MSRANSSPVTLALLAVLIFWLHPSRVSAQHPRMLLDVADACVEAFARDNATAAASPTEIVVAAVAACRNVYDRVEAQALVYMTEQGYSEGESIETIRRYIAERKKRAQDDALTEIIRSRGSRINR